MFQSITNVFGTALSVLGGIAGFFALLVGLVTLFFGRKLFWLFAGLIGLTTGLLIAPDLLPAQSGLIHFLVGLSVGILCAFLAIYLNKIMIILAGFLGLGIIGYSIAGFFNLSSLFHWILFLGFGALGAWLMSKYMDWAIVVISAVIGAILVSVGLGLLIHMNFLLDMLIFIVVVGSGIFLQSRSLIKK